MLELGSFTINFYFLALLLGFLVAGAFAIKLVKRWGVAPDIAINASVVGFIGGLIGAKVYFLALSWQAFLAHPVQMLQDWGHGRSIHGGIIAGVASGALYLRMHGISMLLGCDAAGAVMGIGQAIGRWGNFFNIEAFGTPVDESFPLKLYIPSQFRPANYAGSSYFHPTFLYESLWDLAIFVLLYFYGAQRMRPFPGACFLSYIFLYSLGRLFIEPLRSDSLTVLNLPAASMASAVGLIGSTIGLLWIFRAKLAKR